MMSGEKKALPPLARDPKTGQFLVGHSGNGGRKKGARSKLGEAFLEAMHDDFNENGPETIVRVREERPHEYLKVIASLLPRDVKLEIDASQAFQDMLEALGEISNAGLAARIDRQRKRSEDIRH